MKDIIRNLQHIASDAEDLGNQVSDVIGDLKEIDKKPARELSEDYSGNLPEISKREIIDEYWDDITEADLILMMRGIFKRQGKTHDPWPGVQNP